MDENKTFHDFEAKYDEEQRKLKQPTILVAGYTGAGKTSLIQGICGPEVVPDSKIGAGLPKTQFFDFYQGKSVRFFDSKGLEPGDTEEKFVADVQKFVRQLQDDPDVDKHVHLVWYAIQGPGARVTPCDLRLMKEIFPRNQIALITKNDITRPQQREAMMQVLKDAGTPAERIVLCSDEDKESLRTLEELSYRMLPDAYRDAFNASQIVNLDRKKVKAQLTIQGAAGAAAAAGAVPIPFSDSAIITPIQLTMVAALAVLYGEPKEGLKAALMPMIAEAIGIQTAASLTKLFPGIGSVINAAIAFALTEAIGQVTNAYLVKRFNARLDGTPPPDFTFDPRDFKQAYEAARAKAA